MYWRNLFLLTAAIAVVPIDLGATSNDVGGIDIIVKKKPSGSKFASQTTGRDGRVRFVIEIAGTYQITVNTPATIAPGAAIQVIGNVSNRAVTQGGVNNAPESPRALKPASPSLATGRMVVNSSGTQAQLLAFGAVSASSDTLIEEEITFESPAILDLQVSLANDPVPTAGLTFAAAEGSSRTLPQTLPLRAPDAGVRTFAVSAAPGAFQVQISNANVTVNAGAPDPVVQVTAFPGALKAGLYSVLLSVKITGDVSTTRTVPVYLLVVKGSLGPSVDKSALVFTSQVGALPSPQTVRISNLEGTAAAYRIDFASPSDASYLSLTPRTLQLNAGASQNVTVQPLAAGMGVPGVKDVRLTIVKTSAPDAPQVVNVKLIATAAACAPTQLIPVLVELPGTLVAGLPSSGSVLVIDDCGGIGYNATVRGQDEGYTVFGVFSTANSGIETVALTAAPSAKNKDNGPLALTLNASGSDAVGNQLAGSGSVDRMLQTAGKLPTIQDIGILAYPADLSTEAFNNVQPVVFAAGQSIEILGDNLVKGNASASSNSALPTQLGDTVLLLGGRPIPLISVSATKIQAVLPFDVTPGQHQIVLTDVTGKLPPVALPPLVIQDAAPSIVTRNSSSVGPATLWKVTTQGLTKVTSANPAAPGDTIRFNATGLGAVNPPVAAGQPIAASDTSHKVAGPLLFKVGNLPGIAPAGAWLAPGNQGEYTVEIKVPDGLTALVDGAAAFPMRLESGTADCQCYDENSIFNVTGTFLAKKSLTAKMTFTTFPVTGLSLNINGSPRVSPVTLPFPTGSFVTVSVATPQSIAGNTNTRYALAPSFPNPATFPAANTKITIPFEAQYKLTLSPPLAANPAGSAGFYTKGTQVTLSGACGPSENFIGFNIQQGSAAAVQTLNPKVTMTAPATASLVCKTKAASIIAIGGFQQSTVVNAAFAQPLQVRVADLSGNPVPSVIVTFAVPSTGATAVLSSVTAATNAAGVASVTAQANAIPGSYFVFASIAGVLHSAVFNLANAPATATISVTANYGDAKISVTVNGTKTDYIGTTGKLTVNSNDTVVLSNPPVQTPNAGVRYVNAYSTDPVTLPTPIASGASSIFFLASYKLTINGTAATSPSSADGFYMQTTNIFIPVTVTGSCPSGQPVSGLQLTFPAYYPINGQFRPAGTPITVSNGSVITMDRPWTVDVVCPSRAQGTISAWGRNNYGQLGNGTNIDSATPVTVSGLSGVVAVAGAADHSLVAKSDGTVWAWGRNTHGQLGNGTTADSNIPVPVSGLTGVVAVAAGGYGKERGTEFSLALKSDGTVWAWGNNGFGELGNGTLNESNIPGQVSGLTGVVAIAGGDGFGLALKSDGSVRAWGYNGYGQLGDGTNVHATTPVAVIGLTGVVAIAAGDNHVLALKSDGTLSVWGYGGFGQLGNGGLANSNTPVPLTGLTGVAAIAGGTLYSLAVMQGDGSVRAWGYNAYGQFGDGTTTTSVTPVPVSALTGVLAVAAGVYEVQAHSLALKSDGTVWAAGAGTYGQLGNGIFNGSFSPVAVSGLSGVVSISVGADHSLALVGKP